MATLLDFDWTVGGDANPVGGVLATSPGEGTFRRVSGAGAVSTANTFSLIYDTGHTATATHRATVYISTLGGRDVGGAVRINTTTGACYFMTNSNASDIYVYYYNGAGGFTQIDGGALTGQVYTTGPTDNYSLDVNGTTLRVMKNGVQIGSNITDSNLSGGQPGVTGYDGTFRLSRIVTSDDSAAAANDAYLTMPPIRPPMAAGARR